jgi:predicted negative regulator of RcsB-dependent stress response
MPVLRSTTSIAIALLAAAPTALADKILLVDGTVLTDVNVKEETLTVVRYDREEVPSEKVLRIEFDSFPDTVGEAELMAAEGDIASAALQLYYYVDASTSSNPERREPWAPAWAAQRRIELLASVNDLQSVVEAADLLLSKFPESRYVPGAYLSKAEALAQQGETAAASATLGALVKLAEAESLSPRWRLSAEVERAAIDGQASFAARVDALEALAAAAGDDFPTVRDRAYVAQGEVYVAQADAGDDVAGSLQSARGMFELALESEQAEGVTRAGALVGLADCDFAQASRDSDVEGLTRARDNYLRVIVLHPEQARYVAKALYLCGLCFRQLGDLQEDDESKARARTLMRRLIRDFEGTTWAADARRYA